MARRLFRGNAFSENGWPYVDTGSCRWVTVPGTTVSLQVQDGIPAQVMPALAADINAYVEPLSDRDSACWTQDNTVATSNHPGGTAEDLDWERHPYLRRGTFNPRQLAEIQAILDFYEDMIFWAGIDWSGGGWGPGNIDEMHWQMGYGTYLTNEDRAHPRCQDFINRKIRADGFSTYRRGGSDTPDDHATQLAILRAATSLDAAKVAQILPTLRDGLKLARCTNPNRIAMFIAQTRHESDNYNTTVEYGTGQRYAPYIGRTWIQITWQSNYEAFGRWAVSQGLITDPDQFVNDPESLADIRWAGIGAAWFWTAAHGSHNMINDDSDRGDVTAVTHTINGGENGLGLRINYYNQAIAQGDSLLSLLDETEDDMPTHTGRSWSFYRTNDDDQGWQGTDMDFHVAGMAEEEQVERLAQLGDPWCLSLVHRVAEGDQSMPAVAAGQPGISDRANSILAKAPKAAHAKAKALAAQKLKVQPE